MPKWLRLWNSIRVSAPLTSSEWIDPPSLRLPLMSFIAPWGDVLSPCSFIRSDCMKKRQQWLTFERRKSSSPSTTFSSHSCTDYSLLRRLFMTLYFVPARKRVHDWVCCALGAVFSPDPPYSSTLCLFLWRYACLWGSLDLPLYDASSFKI
jgi:hypothetical protein